MTHQRLCHFRTRGHDEVENPGRQTSFFENFDKGGRDGGSLWGGFPNDRVTRNQGRENFPGGDSDREIPRRDETHNARRVTNSHAEFIWHFYRCCVAKQATSLAAHKVGHVDGLLHIAARFCDHFTHITREQLRKFLFFLLEDIPDFEEHFSAQWGRSQSPGFVSMQGCVCCGIHILNISLRNICKHFFVSRIDGLKCVSSVDPLAIDVVLEFHRYPKER